MQCLFQTDETIAAGWPRLRLGKLHGSDASPGNLVGQSMKLGREPGWPKSSNADGSDARTLSAIGEGVSTLEGRRSSGSTLVASSESTRRREFGAPRRSAGREARQTCLDYLDSQVADDPDWPRMAATGLGRTARQIHLSRCRV